MPFLLKTIDELDVEDEASFRHVSIYADLKETLRRDRYTFRVLPETQAGRWDRALALNLTFWGSDATGGDVLVDSTIPADVVAHVAWHHLAARALKMGDAPPSAQALFLGESIASAFDVYLVGRLLGHAPDSSFLATQVPRMGDAAADAGVSEEAFERLLSEIAKEPERAFESLRELLYQTTCALALCRGADDALEVFARADTHPMAPLLHRHELSNWVLYAKAYASTSRDDAAATAIDAALREAPDAVEWLSRWLV